MYTPAKEMAGPKLGKSGFGGDNREEGNTESSRGEIMGPGARNGKDHTPQTEGGVSGTRSPPSQFPHAPRLWDRAETARREKEKKLGVITSQGVSGGNSSFSPPWRYFLGPETAAGIFEFVRAHVLVLPRYHPPFAEKVRKWRYVHFASEGKGPALATSHDGRSR